MIFHNVTSNVSFTRKSLWIKKTLPFAPVVTSVTKRSFPPWGKKPLWSIWKQHLISLCWWHVLLSGWKRCCSPYWPCSPCWQGSHNLIGFTSLLTKCIYLYFYICLHACMSEFTTVSNHSVRLDQHPLNDAPSAVEMFLFVFNKNVFICALLIQKNLWCKKKCDALPFRFLFRFMFSLCNLDSTDENFVFADFGSVHSTLWKSASIIQSKVAIIKIVMMHKTSWCIT